MHSVGFSPLSDHDKWLSSIDAVIFPRHVEGKKLDRTVWSLSTFHAYVSYHVKVRFLYPKFVYSCFFCLEVVRLCIFSVFMALKAVKHLLAQASGIPSTYFYLRVELSPFW